MTEIVDNGRQVPGPTTTGLRRVTVVTQVYHHSDDGEAVGVEVARSHECAVTESPLKRVVVVADEWLPVRFEWVGDPSLATLINELTAWASQPSPEHRKADAQRILEVAVSEPGSDAKFHFADVLVGYPLTWTPVPGKSYHVRCAVPGGTCRVTLFACPR